MAAGRTLELIETKEIEQLLATVLDDMHEKEKETLEQEVKAKIQARADALTQFKQEVKAKIQ